MERAVQILAVVNFTVVGLSHVTAHRAWADFFLRLRSRGEAGVFVVAFMSLAFGSIVVAFHNVWSGIPVALTLIGWAQVLKAFTYFVFPAYGLKRMRMVAAERSRLFVYPGILLLVLAALLAYHLATAPAAG